MDSFYEEYGTFIVTAIFAFGIVSGMAYVLSSLLSGDMITDSVVMQWLLS